MLEVLAHHLRPEMTRRILTAGVPGAAAVMWLVMLLRGELTPRSALYAALAATLGGATYAVKRTALAWLVTRMSSHR